MKVVHTSCQSRLEKLPMPDQTRVLGQDGLQSGCICASQINAIDASSFIGTFDQLQVV